MLAIVWGISGMLGVLAFAGLALIFVVGALAYAEESRARSGPLGWWRNALAVVCWALSFLSAVLAVASLWGATHVRTLRLTVEHRHDDVTESDSYYVDDTTGNSYDTSEAVYNGLSRGDRVECRATSPLFLQATLLSCKQLPKPPRRR
jgi:hypothetical protein